MRETAKYFISALGGGVLGVIVYAVVVFANQYDFSTAHAIISLLLGFVIGSFLVKFLSLKHRRLYSDDRFRPWMLLFVEANLFFGVLGGLILGILASWLLLFPFSLLFGHPESGWTPFVANLFKILSLAIGMVSFAFLVYFCLKGSILYLEKKMGSET